MCNVKRLFFFSGIGILFVLIASCQQMFTYSPVSWAQRDPSTLSDDQKITYAEDVLSSGDTKTIAEAYDLINDLVTANPDDVQLQLLAADLALGGSGIADTIENIDLDTLDSGSIEDILSGIDLDLVSASADHVIAAEALDPSAISDVQYLNTGLILLAKAADEAVGGFPSLSTITSTDAGWTTLVQADDFITKGGGDITDYGVTNSNLP